MDPLDQAEEFQRLSIHADLQAHMNRHIVSSALKKVNHWLLTSRVFTPQNVDDCKDFSDIWDVLSSMSFITVGKYEKLKELCNRIEELKYMVPEIESHEERIRSIVNSVSSQQNDKQDDSLQLSRSISFTSRTMCPECGTRINVNVSTQLDDGDHSHCLHSRRNNCQKCQEDELPVARETARGHRRTASLPGSVKMSKEQEETSDDPCALKSLSALPRQRHQTERCSQWSDRRFVRSPSCDHVNLHQMRIPYSYSSSSLLDLSSLADLVGQNQHDDPYRFWDTGGSPESEPIFFGVSPNSRRSSSVSSLNTASALVVFSEGTCRPGMQNFAVGDLSMSPPSMQMNMLQMIEHDDVQSYIQDKYSKLQLVNQSFKHLAIYLHIATLAMARRSELKINLKECLAKIYSLNNFWMITLNDCHNNASNVAECTKDIAWNMLSGCTSFAEYDLKTFERHVSEIKKSVGEMRPVVRDIESNIAEVEQDFMKEQCDCKVKSEVNLLKLASVAVRNMKPILSRFSRILDYLNIEVDTCWKENVSVIKNGVDQAPQTGGQERRTFLEGMESNKIRWIALKQFCMMDCPKHGETKVLIRNLFKDDPAPGTDTEKRAWDLADKMVKMLRYNSRK